MKKGFTLIELLAVILILGIIALIAIPTVNNIIKEARTGAFLTSSNNMMKQIEQDCQTSLLKGENPTLSYTFSNNESSSKIEIKGTLPNDGYILLNKECTITDYYLSDNNSTYSNSEDVRDDYMLKAPFEESSSIFKSMYNSYFDNIISIDFVNSLNIPENAIEIKDPSVSEKGKIKSWLIPVDENYQLYVGSEGKIYANYNSAHLFKNYFILENINLSNFDTSFVNSMYQMFENCLAITELNVDNFITSNVTDMFSIFNLCKNLQNINVNNFDTKNVINMQYMFGNCQQLKVIDVSNFDTRNVTNMFGMFGECFNLENIIGLEFFNTSNVTTIGYIFGQDKKLISLNIGNWDISKVENVGSLIYLCTSLNTLDLANWNFQSVIDLSSIFSYAHFNNIILQNAEIANMLINYLPTKTIDSPGTITIKGDKTGLDIETLESINWNVI